MLKAWGLRRQGVTQRLAVSGPARIESLENRQMLHGGVDHAHTDMPLASEVVLPVVTSLTLMNASSQAEIGIIQDEATLNLDVTGTQLNFRADTSFDTGSVRFVLDGVERIETMKPYAALGDVAGKFNAWTPIAGAHQILVTPYTGAGATGLAGETVQIDFTVTGPTPAPVVPAVAQLKLINAATDQVIGDLTNNMVLDLAKLGNQLNVRADTSPETVGSVAFVLDGKTINIDHVAPYALGGHEGEDYLPWTPTVGRHTLTVIPFDSPGGTGTPGLSKTVTFTVGLNTTPSSVSWKTMAPSPIGRAESVGVAANGKLYVMGGFYLQGSAIKAYARCDVFDPAANTWTRIADMPEPFTHASGTFDGRSIWFVGGYVGNHPGGGTTRVWKYDTVANKWSRGPDLPVARGAGASAMVGRTIYFFGGMNQSRTADTTDHFALNLDNQGAGWVRKASLLKARNHVSAAALDGKVYVIGGQRSQEQGQVAYNNVERYDPATNRWTPVANLPAVRSHTTGGTFTMDGRIIVVGGESKFVTTHREIFAYEPTANKWSLLGLLPAQRSTTVAGVIDGKIVVATGNNPNPTVNTWIGTVS